MDADNNTPLHFAAQNGHDGVVELLIGGGGASIETINTDNNTLLNLAVLRGRSGITGLLFKATSREI